jgi:hypothetical protein
MTMDKKECYGRTVVAAGRGFCPQILFFWILYIFACACCVVIFTHCIFCILAGHVVDVFLDDSGCSARVFERGEF